MIREYVRHNIFGNGRSRRTVGFNRGALAAAMMGAVNFVMILIPIPAETKVELNVALGPVIILGSFMLYGHIDKAVKGEEDAE